jgi:hypothetical protein
MKRPVLVVIALVAIAIGAYFLFFKKTENVKAPKDQPLAIGENTGAFNDSYSQLLSSYFQLKDALVASDTAKANVAAAALLLAADSLKVEDIKGDSTGALRETARSYALSVNGSAKAILGEPTLLAKRKEFEMVTDIIWNLTRTVRYAGQKIYYLHCPMAFENKGAYWMSAESEVRNPYFGDEMLNCGAVQDSLDYTKK